MPRCNIDHQLLPAQAQHAGLWFDKYLRQPKDKKTYGVHVADAAAIAEPPIYREFFGRWQQALASVPDTVTKEARCLGRLAVGLGNESAIETSISLHRTYGMPYIPGSALKGLAASYARQRLGAQWQADSEAYRTLFGCAPQKSDAGMPLPTAETNASAAGYVTFFDALYVPGTGESRRALYPDVVTVHHQDYYNKARPEAPADWDDPNPVPFLTATGQYLLAISGPPAWVTAAYEMLAHALIEYGVGAKTHAGYGRMSVKGYESLVPSAAGNAAAPAGRPQPADPKKALVSDFVDQVNRLPNPRVAGEIGAYYQKWKALDVSPADKKEAAKAIVQKVIEAGREKASLEKPWYQEVKAAAGS